MAHDCPLQVALAIALLLLKFAKGANPASTASSNCPPAPISIPITNVSIAKSQNNALVRGIAIGVGTPPQNLAMLPYWFNNSFVYDGNNLCDAPAASQESIPPQSCITWRGGAFDLAASNTTSQGTPNTNVADSSPYPATIDYSDLWTLGKAATLQDFTFGIPQSDWGEQFYQPQAVLGLGRNSTLLQALKDKNLISSRTWSIHWGLDGTAEGGYTNGSLVFGGYDAARISTTQNYTAKLNYTACPGYGLAIQVADVSLFSTSAAYTTLSNTTVPVPTCTDPGAAGMVNMPYYGVGMFQRYVQYTNYTSFLANGLGNGSVRSYGLNFYDMLYFPEDNRYTGQLVINIKDAFNITVSNSQLIVPHIYMDATSGTWETNTTQWDLLIDSINSEGAAANSMALNRHITTFLYIMVNQETEEFTLWPALTGSSAENLVAVDENNNNILISTSTTCTPASGTSQTSMAQTSSSSASSSSSSPTLPSGTIAGIAIGAALALALACLATWWCRRRSKRSSSASTPSQSGTELISPSGFDDYNRKSTMAAQLSSDRATEMSWFQGSQTSTRVASPNTLSFVNWGPPELSGESKTLHYELQG